MALHAREQKGKVILEDVLKQARRDCHAKVVVSMLAPALDKRPDRIRLSLIELADCDDCLPARIRLPFGRGAPG